MPGTADLALALYLMEDEAGESHGLLDASDSASLGGGESVSVGEGILTTQTGWYEVVVSSSSGSSCTDTYTLLIDANSR